jgi:hypothetical protein
LQFWGLRASADVTNLDGLTNKVTRQITLKMDASSVATATAAKQSGTRFGGILSVTVTGQGMDYIRPPLPVIADATGSGAVLGGTGLQVLATSQLVQGNSSYTANVTAVAQDGGLAPGGVPATFSVTVVAGTITAVTCTNTPTNGPYNFPPTIVISDPGNPSGGAVWLTRMGLFPKIAVLTPGGGYTSPTISFTPFFKTMCPDTAAAAQANAVRGWMKNVLGFAAATPVGETSPVVS